ncbi:LysR family transcriptional regulator [Kitasatospora sp. NPDC057015]|uniref:LysR family transcriptional regulator n=1 Tax=Kitasatospora sp. NPDC057015 TaxID=3346001 RepID=UPI00363B7DCD
METRRLRLLLELSRLGSMREVAEQLGTTTSTVSQQIAVLATEYGTTLIEPDGRRVRLTPAGRRLAEHAVTILAAHEAAHADLDPGAVPAGTVRVAGFATAIRHSLLPIITRLADTHPRVRLVVREHEPAEATALLAADEVDLALSYDYNLAPAAADRALESVPLWSTAFGLGVSDPDPGGTERTGGEAAAVFAGFRGHDWIGNSRNSADEDVIRVLASTAGFEPRVTHQADSLELVEDMIVAGLGVGLLPADRVTRPGVRILPLTRPDVVLRAHTLVRRGRGHWPPLALLLDLLTGGSAPDPGRSAPAEPAGAPARR